MNFNQFENESDNVNASYQGLFTIKKSLDGELSADFQDKMQFIGIKVASDEFLLTIDSISEIIMLTPITYVPNSPKYIEGVINLRGTILPVINVRKMMGMPRGNSSLATRIIVCRHESLNIKFGLLVDSITFVVALLLDEIDSSSPPASRSGHELLSGVSKHGQTVSGILDLDKILGIAAEGKTLAVEEEQQQEASGH